jgi:hypothetical protein
MAYWRMQLHPNDPSKASEYAARSLCAGFIGLDFAGEPGDLMHADPQSVSLSQRDYFAFATQLAVGDLVLIMAHHHPFALCTVAGDYNYIRECDEDLGIWFRHFRRVSDVRFYADRVTNAHSWQRITMTDTISPLHDPQSQSYQLIHSW